VFWKRANTVDLSTQSFVLENAKPYRQWLIAACVVMAFAALGYLGLNYIDRMYSPASRVAELQTVNAQIEETLTQTRAELEEVRLKREMEQATQAELEKQLKDLNAEVSRLKEELNFFKKTKKQPS